MGVLGAGTSRKKGGLRNLNSPKSGILGTSLVKREDLRNWSCTKGGSYLSHLFTFTCQYDLQTKNRGLRNGHNQKRGGGVLGARPTRKRGVLGAGQVKQNGSLPPHIHVLDTYPPPPPPHIMLEVGLQKSMGHGIYCIPRTKYVRGILWFSRRYAAAASAAAASASADTSSFSR